jgi:hypothetical protein
MGKSKAKRKRRKLLDAGRTFNDTLSILNMQSNILTKNQLANLLFSKTMFGGGITLNGIDFVGILSVEREDGSGKSFNVTGLTSEGGKATVHVRIA